MLQRSTATNSDDSSYFCFYSSQLLKWITLCGTSFLCCHLLKINSRKKNFENRNPGLEKKRHLWIWTGRVFMPMKMDIGTNSNPLLFFFPIYVQQESSSSMSVWWIYMYVIWRTYKCMWYVVSRSKVYSTLILTLNFFKKN